MLATKSQVSNHKRIKRDPKSSLQSLEGLFFYFSRRIDIHWSQKAWEGAHQKVGERFLIASTCTHFLSLLFCFLLVLPAFKQDNNKKIPLLLLKIYKTIAQTGFIPPALPWFSGSFLVLGKQPQQTFFITATVPGMWPGKKVVCPENSSSSLGAAVAWGICREFPGNT